MLSEQLKKKFVDRASCFDNNKYIAEENKSKFILSLPKNQGWESCRIRVDNCLIKDNDMNMEKCDFWFHVSDKKENSMSENYNIFVELKGRDVEKAYSQIKTTINWVKHKMDLPKSKLYAAIVISKYPKSASDSGVLKAEFRKKYGNRLEIKSRELEFRLP